MDIFPITHLEKSLISQYSNSFQCFLISAPCLDIPPIKRPEKIKYLQVLSNALQCFLISAPCLDIPPIKRPEKINYFAMFSNSFQCFLISAPCLDIPPIKRLEKINVTQRRPQLSEQAAKRRAESVVSEEYIYFLQQA
jgi:hypothetical protein